MFWSNNSATTFAIANTDFLVIFLLPAINIPKGSAHLSNPFDFKVALSVVDTVCAFLHSITFTFPLSVEEACTLTKNVHEFLIIIRALLKSFYIRKYSSYNEYILTNFGKQIRKWVEEVSSS